MTNQKQRLRTPLTPEQSGDAKRLSCKWDEWKRARRQLKLPYSQEWIGQQFDPPISQGAVWQYMNAHIPLNVSAVAEFAKILFISPNEISVSLGKILTQSADQVSQSSDSLSAQLAHHVKPQLTDDPGSLTKVPPGVFGWEEVWNMIRDKQIHQLPEVFSVEVPDDALTGYVKVGDVVTLNRGLRDSPKAGDGILVRSNGPGNPFIALRLYRPKGDGTYTAAASHSDFEPLRSVQDQLDILAVVTGVPTCRWSNR